MPSAHVTIQTYQNIVLAAIEKDRLTDANSINAAGDELMKILDRHPKVSLVLDLKKVAAMSSQMIGKLVALHKAVVKGKGRMAVCGSQKGILPLFKVTKLDRVFDLRSDAQEALLFYQRKPL